MNVTITLVNPGADTGPFNIYTNDDNYVTAVATNVAKALLVSGYDVSVPPYAVTIKVESTGNCSSCIFLPITQPTTTTTTSTSSSTTSTTTTDYPDTTTTSSTTTLIRYVIRRSLVTDDLTCTTGQVDSDWWSFTSIPNGYYKINGQTTPRYKLETLGSGTYNPANQITSYELADCIPVQYFYYLAEEYYCSTCSIVDAQAPPMLVFSTSSGLVDGKFYTSFNASNYVYKIVNSGQSPGAGYQINTTPFGSCADIGGCGTVSTTLPPFELNEVWAGYNATDSAAACTATPARVYSYSDFTGADAFYSDIYGVNKAADGYYSAPTGPTQVQRYRQQVDGTLYSGAIVC